MRPEAVLAVLSGLLLPWPCVAQDPKTDLHGMALGMTADQVTSAAALPCSRPAYSSDIACRDASDGSDYTASMSAGQPSVVLMIARSFCSHDATAAVLDRMLNAFHASRPQAQPDPNGFHVDLSDKVEAILNADDGTCPDGRGKHYVLSLRDNGLITTESNSAVKRAKDAMH